MNETTVTTPNELEIRIDGGATAPSSSARIDALLEKIAA